MSQQKRGRRQQVQQSESGLMLTQEMVEESSVYPPAELVRQFEDIQPGMADRMMKMAEAEQIFRHNAVNQQNNEIVRCNTAKIAAQNRHLDLMQLGQWLGLSCVTLLIALAGLAVYWHEPWVAVAAIGAIIGTLVVYVLRRTPKNDNTGNTQS